MHYFGLSFKKEEEPDLYWGARAIYKDNRSIDLLHDRQSWVGEKPNEKKLLAQWVNEEGIPRLQRLVKDLYLDPSENRRIHIVDEENGYVISANPNGSYGYLYIAAYSGYLEGEDVFTTKEALTEEESNQKRKADIDLTKATAKKHKLSFNMASTLYDIYGEIKRSNEFSPYLLEKRTQNALEKRGFLEVSEGKVCMTELGMEVGSKILRPYDLP